MTLIIFSTHIAELKYGTNLWYITLIPNLGQNVNHESMQCQSSVQIASK